MLDLLMRMMHLQMKYNLTEKQSILVFRLLQTLQLRTQYIAEHTATPNERV